MPWTVTSRGGSSTVSPRRANRCAARPAIFRAEKAGGSWSCVPTKVCSAAAMRSSAGSGHPGSRLVEIGLDGAAGGPGVAPASELAGDGDRVGSVTGAHGDPDAFWFGFLEEQDDVCPLRQAHQVDETFGRAGIVLRLGEHR